MASAARVVERALVAVALLVVAVSIAVGVITQPWFTRTVTSRLDVARATGLTSAQAEQVAEQVRRFSTDGNAPPLPARVYSRSGFDESAVSHLADVRGVLVGMRTAGLVLGGLLACWFALCVVLHRSEAMATALRWGGAACLASPIVLAAFGLFAFDTLFAAMHGLFFEAGTWTFPSDSLLIELFPEPFWVTAGASLAALVMILGAAMLVVAWMLRRSSGPDVADASTTRA